MTNEEGANPLTTIVSYIKQVAEALQYAHEEKFVHRDVKPENMLVGRLRGTKGTGWGSGSPLRKELLRPH